MGLAHERHALYLFISQCLAYTYSVSLSGQP